MADEVDQDAMAAAWEAEAAGDATGGGGDDAFAAEW